MTFRDNVKQWLNPPFDQITKNQVNNLKKRPEDLEDAFYKDLSFGTGGMRGLMNVGPNRINKYTLGKATQGLSLFLTNEYPNETLKVVIAYDSRHQSREFAKIVADIFTANKIHCYLFSDLRPTPELSFAVRHLNAHCGIVLTASHNPPEYNGYKVYGKDGGQLVPPLDYKIIQTIEKTTFDSIRFKGNSNLLHYVDKEIDDAYHQTVIEVAQMHKLSKDDFQVAFTPIHGTSITALPQVLKKAGYKNVHIVPEQEIPDGSFPTVSSPNPEEPQALQMALVLAKEKNADLVIGTDPDADRFGIIIKDSKNKWKFLNGNQIMMILTEYLLNKNQSQGVLTPMHFIATTIVSTPAIEKMAMHFNIQFKKCLTGFKWIAKLVEDYPELHFIGGGEESFGYLVGDTVRDKDAISASLLACEIAVEAKAKGTNLFELLIDCYKKYGAYKERLISITKAGKSGLEQINTIMNGFRKNSPQTISSIRVIDVEDYQKGISKNLLTLKETKIHLPKANVLIFKLEDGTQIALRPSGTEPKIKYYFSVNQEYNSEQTWEHQEITMEKRLNDFETSFKKL